MSERDLPKNGDQDPVDDAYRGAEALLSDEDARAARRAKVLAAVGREAPAAEPSLDRRRGSLRWAGWLAAACVAGLGLFVTAEIYRPFPPPPPTPAPRPPPPAATVAPTVRGGRAISAAPGAQAIAPSKPTPAPAAASHKLQAGRREQLPAPAAGLIPAPPPAAVSEPERRAISAPVAKASAPPAPPPPAADEVQALAPTASPPPAPPPVARAAPATSPAPQAQSEGASVSELVTTGSRRDDPGARLRAAAAAGRTGEVKALLARGAPVDDTDADGDSALMKAVRSDRPATTALLIRHGASLDLRNNAGESARDMAAGKDDPALQRALQPAP